MPTAAFVPDSLGHLGGTDVPKPAAQLDGNETFCHQPLADLHCLGVVVDRHRRHFDLGSHDGLTMELGIHIRSHKDKKLLSKPFDFSPVLVIRVQRKTELSLS